MSYAWLVRNGMPIRCSRRRASSSVLAVVTTEMFLITKSFWAIVTALVLHVIGYLMCLREPRWLDLWIQKVSRCPRVKNYSHWRCNSYSPSSYEP